MPLGIMPEGVYSAGEKNLEVGDTLILYTDGITEPENPDDEEYGEERLREVCVANREKPVAEIMAAIEKNLYEFARGVPFPSRLDDWGGYEWDHSVTTSHGPRLRAFLENVVFVSKFLDRKLDDYGFGGPLLRAAYAAYRPLAWARVRSGLLSPLPERRVYGWLRAATGGPGRGRTAPVK